MQDTNENIQNDDDDNEKEKNLPSPALEIEGIVRGEPDTGIVQSGGNVSLNETQEEVLNMFFSLKNIVLLFY